jgi:hypothetical protein
MIDLEYTRVVSTYGDEVRQPCAYCSETTREGGCYRGITYGPTARRFCSISHLRALETWEEYKAESVSV